jgi:uncharacterized Zn finger protein
MTKFTIKCDSCGKEIIVKYYYKDYERDKLIRCGHCNDTEILNYWDLMDREKEK